MYRRFNDAEEEDEEEIDAEDLGLLEHVENGEMTVKPLKTLSRKSIKPTRLFQKEKQKLACEREQEEEAPTDVDEAAAGPSNVNIDESAQPFVPSVEAGVDKPKKTSPFDTWPRVKAGSKAASSLAKTPKRKASDAMLDDSDSRRVSDTPRTRKARA